jgi:methyltransferase family protein
MIRDFIHKPVLTAAHLRAEQIAPTGAPNQVERLFAEHEGERCDRWRHYLPVYARHLAPFVAGCAKRVRFLEIGVANGGSFQIWRRFFGPDAALYGLDISKSEEAARALASVGAHLFLGDQKDPSVLGHIMALEDGHFDVVIDDGSHFSSDQITTFENLYPRLTPGGVYICEDTHTSYFEGLRAPSTFVEYAKKKVDELHSWYVDDSAGISDTFALMTSAVLFYDSMIVFERASASKGEPRRVVVGNNE